MNARERRGLRLGLLAVIAASVVLAMLGWSLWPLGGVIFPAFYLWIIRPKTGEAPRKNRGASHPKG